MVDDNNVFDEQKFLQMLHYVIYKTSGLQNVGKVVLYKIMYFSDFDFYELCDKSISGESYFKLPLGPAPSHFETGITKLQSKKKVKVINTKYGSFNQIKAISFSEPSLNLLNGDELRIIDKAIQKLSSMSGSGASAYSHEDIPWKATESGKEIDYELVFYRDDKFSVKNGLEISC
ncbi:SocA family protein [archaeon]|nr:SocA family protein [archaeon]MBT7001288.1 SocA family protein [archaeon]MBT7282226.1 SocA family protein [archaeon]